MNFTLLLSALRARFRLFLLILGTTVLAAVIASMLMPKTYVAKVSLLVDGKDEQSLHSGVRPPERERTGYLQTQVDIIMSPKVAQRVVRELNLADNATARAKVGAEDFDPRGTAPIEEWVADRLLKRLKVDTSSSSVVQLSFAAADPKLASLVANAFAKSYVDTTLDLRVEPTRQASAWFNEQLKGLRVNLEQAEQRLAAFRQEHGISTLDERYDVDNMQLTDLATMVTRTREPGSGSPSLSEILNSPNLQALRGELRRAEARLREMSAEFGSNHPQYLRQQAQVESLRAAVAGEARSAVSGVDAAKQRSKANREALTAELEAKRDRVLKLAQARTQMAVLTHDAAIAQRTYDDAMQRYLASNIESRALQTNVSVLDAATPPAQPARPRMLLNVGIALVVGMLLGLATVHLLEMFDQRVRLVEDLAGDVQVPLLAVLDKWNPTADRLPGPDVYRALTGPA
jgi:chain length determinant protein EpsF